MDYTMLAIKNSVVALLAKIEIIYWSVQRSRVTGIDCLETDYLHFNK